MANSRLVWLITGTSSGIGRDIALAALKRGDHVIATTRARSFSKLQVLKDAGAAILELDVTSSLGTLHEVAKDANAIYGHIDIVVNNAAYVGTGAIEESTPEETYDQYNTNVFGALNVARAFLPYMRPRKTGTIVWIGSLAGWIAIPDIGLYVSTKHALRGIAETMNEELQPLGLRSMIFEYGYFRTDVFAPGNITPHNSRIADYADMSSKAIKDITELHGKQPGDSTKAAEYVVDLVKGEGVAQGREVPVVLQFGQDCYETVHSKLKERLSVMEEWKHVSTSTNHAE